MGKYQSIRTPLNHMFIPTGTIFLIRKQFTGAFFVFRREEKSFAEVYTFMESLMKTNAKELNSSQKALGEHMVQYFQF